MGEVVVIVVALSVRMTAARPLKVTVAPGSKLVPVIVTRVPMGPLAGSTVLIAGPTLTVKPRVTVASLPARSRAVIEKMCGPVRRPVSVTGEAAPATGTPSRRSVTPRSGAAGRLSLTAKANLTLADVTAPSEGPSVSGMTGGALSTVAMPVSGAAFL